MKPKKREVKEKKESKRKRKKKQGDRNRKRRRKEERKLKKKEREMKKNVLVLPNRKFITLKYSLTSIMIEKVRKSVSFLKV